MHSWHWTFPRSLAISNALCPDLFRADPMSKPAANKARTCSASSFMTALNNSTSEVFSGSLLVSLMLSLGLSTLDFGPGFESLSRNADLRLVAFLRQL
eukprot:Skav205561  [mRNA]  locus=scaffold1407:25123:29675:+ [translate_table: standard]